MTTIKQTLIYTSGLFRGKTIELLIRCYTKRETSFYMSNALQYGSEVKLLKAEVCLK